MRNPRRKLTVGIVLLLLLTLIFGTLLFFANIWRTASSRMEARAAEMRALDRSMSKLIGTYFDVSMTVLEKSMDKAELVSAVCQKALGERWDGEPMLYMDGAIIKVTEDGVETPEGFPEDLELSAGKILGDDGVTYIVIGDDSLSRKDEYVYLLAYSRIDDSAFYVEWKSFAGFQEKVKGYFDVKESIANMEEVFGTRFLVVSAEADSDGAHSLFYASKSLPAYETAEAYGITEEMLSGAFHEEDDLTSAALAKAMRVLILDGQQYEMYLRELKNSDDAYYGKYTVAFLEPFDDAKSQVWELTVFGTAAFAIIGVIFLIWLFSTLMLVRRYTLNERQQKEFGVSSCWRKIFGGLGVGAAAILAAAALLLSLFRLYSMHQQVDTALLTLEHRIEENDATIQASEELNRKIYETFTTMTAELMSEYPGVVTAEDLQAICDAVGADYMMLFDTEGNEVLSNSAFQGLSLGEDETASTYEFRRLLRGVPLIYHEPTVDEQTLLPHVLIGARVGREEDGALYGALLTAVPEDKIYNSGAESLGDIMASLVYEGMLAFSVDQETGLIAEASDGDLVGDSAAALGMTEKSLQDGFQDFFKLGGVSYYGECTENDGVLYYYAAKNEHIYSGIPLYSLLAALTAFVFLLLPALYLMHGYEEDFDEFCLIGEELEEPMNEIQVAPDRWKRSLDPALRWRMDAPENAARMPVDRAALALQILFLLSVVGIVANMYIGRPNTTGELLRFILKGQWTKGFNLFALTGVFVLLWEVILAVAALKLFVRFISRALGTRGETVCRLLLNILNYTGVLFFLYYALYDLGFAPGTLLASLGLLSFAVSLGAKDLVTDVLAGLSIVFEGDYQVGDIVDIGGYRGEVLEIGARTTKLEGRGGNIKIIFNRDVKNVVNMTRKNSWYPLEVSISADQPLDQIEAMLAEKLPKLGKQIPEIISGPHYKGLTAIGKGSLTLSIITECSEEDYHKVQRSVNRAVQKLLTEQGIKIG